MDFDPDEYLADNEQQAETPPESAPTSGEFDPDAYIKNFDPDKYLASAQQPEQQQQQQQPFDPDAYIKNFDPDKYLASQEKPEAEGHVAADTREAIHGILPAAGMGLVGGALAGAGQAYMGAPLGLPGMLAAGVGGALIGGYLGSKADAAVTKVLGVDDEAQRQANAEARPIETGLAGMLPMAGNPMMAGKTIGQQVAGRGLGAGVMGAFDVGQQLIENGKVDPARTATNMAFGAAFPNGNAATRYLHGVGEGAQVKANGPENHLKESVDTQPTQVSTGDVDPTIAAALKTDRPQAEAPLAEPAGNAPGQVIDAGFPEQPPQQQQAYDQIALQKLRDRGMEDRAAKFEAATENERKAMRPGINNALREDKRAYATNDRGKQVTNGGDIKAKVAQQNRAIAAVDRAYDLHAPPEDKVETLDELRTRLGEAVNTAQEAHGGTNPLNPKTGYAPVGDRAFNWLKHVQNGGAKKPAYWNDKTLAAFQAEEKLIRESDTKNPDLMDAGIAFAGKEGGGAAERELEKGAGTVESHETTALENAYNERHKTTMKELDDYFNGGLDHENLTPKARKILDDMPNDVRKSAFEANEPGADPAHESKVMDWLRETFDPKGEAEPKATDNAAKPTLSLPAAAKASVVKSAPIPPNVGAAAHQGAGGGGGQPPGGGPPAAGAGQPPPPNIAHVPPVQRGKFNEFLRDIKRKFAPQTLGPLGKEAAHDVRESRGVEQRAAEQTTDLLQKHEGTIKSMSPADREAMIDHIEGGSDFPNWQPTVEQRSFMDDFKQAMQTWEAKLRALPTASQMTFKADYLSHYYQNNPQAGTVNFGGYGRRGNAGSTQKRKFDTVQDAKRAGLVPLTDNPIEIGGRYINSIKDFVAHQNLVERGLSTGNVGYFKSPKVVGASGSPQPHVTGGPPPGWKPLAGVAEKNDRVAFAAPDYADVVNNFYDRGFLQNDPTGQKVGVYHVLRNSNNAWTQLELGLNGYHFFTMANEAFIHNIARGIGKTAAGDVAGGLGTIVKSPGAPLTLALEGRRFQKEYMDPNSTDPVAMIAAEANARPVGKGHAADYTFEQRGSFLKHFDVTNLQSEFKRAFNTVKSDVSGDFAKAFGANGTLSDKLSFPFKQASRALATTAAPLFDHYVPLLKAGAVHSQFKDWHAATERKHPTFDMVNNTADRRTAVDAMSKIVDTVDNRFGEMIQDNMFMDAKIKQSAMVAMRSFSWTVGTMKEIGGGAYALGKGLKGLAQGQNKFNMTHPEWDPRAAYPIALTMGVSVLSAIYQALLGSHDAPEGWRDLYAPRTGGTVPGVGQKGQVREHVLMPGYQKDVLGYLTHPMQEAYGKLGGLPTTAIEVAGNKDWRGDPITKPGASMMEAMGQRAAHVFSKLGPISIKNMTKGSEPDSKIGIFQKALGFHAPGSQIQDPERLDQVMNGPRSKDARLWKAKEKRERIQDARQNAGVN